MGNQKKNNNKPQQRGDDELSTDGKRQQTSNNNDKGKSNSQSHKEYNKRRNEAHRRQKGSETVKNYQDKIKAELMPGLETADKLEARIQEIQATRAVMLSVTSRGIGLNLCYTIFASLAYSQVTQPPSGYALYRVALGLFEFRVQNVSEHYPVAPRFTEHQAVLMRDSEFDKLCRTVTFIPEPVKIVLNAIGIVKSGNVTYIPTMAKDLTDKDGRFVPCAENVRYSNLRQVVESLSDVNTPVEYRRRFHQHNSLFGATWGANDLLMNPDEIIPADYTNESFGRDSILITPWLSSLQKFVPKLVSGIMSVAPEGRLGALVCNSMETLKVPDRTGTEAEYYRNCLPTGTVKTAASPIELTSADRLEGILALLGERPSYKNQLDPIYAQRIDAICPYEYMVGQQAAVKLYLGF